jgi:DNA-binding response OmpR family regulator
MVLDTRIMQVSRDGVPLNLTPQEYRLLAYLVMHRGRVVSQLELTEHLYSQDFERDSNAIEVLVGRVRRRLGEGVIKTRRGFGYYVEGEAG